MRVTVEPEPACRYEPPDQFADPVQADGGVTVLTGPVVVPLSASTTVSPAVAVVRVRAVAARAMAGCASSASMLSSVWMTDSAPQLRFTVPSPAMPSTHTPVAGS